MSRPFGTYCPCVDAFSRLDAGEGAWSCPNLIIHTFLMPMGDLPLFEWTQKEEHMGQGEMGWREGPGREKEGETVVGR